jgi:hypothetical protein
MEIELIPHKDGELSPSALVLGFWPVELDKLERVPPYNNISRLCLTYNELNGIKVLAANQNGHEYLFVARIEPAPVPDAWMKRIGNFELINPDGNFKDDRQSSLFIKNGFLIARLSKGSYSVVRALRPISDTEAVTMELAGGLGDTIRVIKQNNDEEILFYTGFQYRRKK